MCIYFIFSVVIDRRRDCKADTGLFDLVYKQNLPRPPAYLGMNLSVRGRRIFKNRSKHKGEKERENEAKKIGNFVTDKIPFSQIQTMHQELSKNFYQDRYKGPVIADFIEEIRRSFDSCDENGIDFVPAASPPPIKKKNNGVRHERVSKCKDSHRINANNKNISLDRRRRGKKNIKRTTAASTKLKFDHDQHAMVKHEDDNDVNANKYAMKQTRCSSSLVSSVGFSDAMITVGHRYMLQLQDV